MKRVFKNLICVSLSFVCMLSTSSCFARVNYDSSRLTNNLYLSNNKTFADGVAKNIIVPSDMGDEIVENIGADCYFIASLDRNKSPFTKYQGPYKKVPMASLTKLMTALVVLNNCKDLNVEYYVSPDAVDLEKDVSKANLKSGDKIKVIDLLYGLLVPSGNDAALCLAENLFDNYDNFIISMNNEAERIGALNSHFSNPHGLDEDHHFSTAYDLFLIMRELAKFPVFRQITLTKEYNAKIVQSDGTIRTENWFNTNFFVTEEMLLSTNTTLLGGKTGNTKTAGNCLVLIVEDKSHGNKYISVVLNAKSKRNVYYNTNALLTLIPK